MPYFRWTLQEINQHNQAHQRGIVRTTKPYCIACYLLLFNHLIPEGFTNFWNWITTQHHALSYTGYTPITFRYLSQNIDTNPDLNFIADITVHIINSIFFSRISIKILLNLVIIFINYLH